MFCDEISSAKVKRTFRSKWRVSYDEYKQRYFPNHCPGFSILYSSDIVPQLYQKAQSLPYFWIDDVFITGLVASQLNISIAPTKNFFLSNSQQDDLLNGRIIADSVPFLFARPNLSEHKIRMLWKLVNEQKPKWKVKGMYLNNVDKLVFANWFRKIKLFEKELSVQYWSHTYLFMFPLVETYSLKILSFLFLSRLLKM